MNTKFYRDNQNKYVGKTELELENGMVLQFDTYSYDGRIVSTAQAVNKESNGNINFVIFKDFNKRIKSVKARSSVKAIEAQHNSIDFEDILFKANEHYLF